jgi:hypothetical protein
VSGIHYSNEVKKGVEKLRAAGKTYTEIREVFSVPKSTLSLWLGKKFKGTFSRQDQLKHLKRIRILAAKTIKARRIARNLIPAERGRAIAGTLPLADKNILKTILAILYWAEGSKYEGVSGLKFVNTDPRLVLLYISILRICFPIDEPRLRIRLHVHHYHNKKRAVSFWSKLLKVPPTQFGKLYVKKRSVQKRFRKNFMGICFIYYPSNAIRIELLELAYAVYARVAQ